MRDEDLSLPQLLGFFAALSVTAFGGANALVPELQRQVVDTHHWLDLRTFAELFAVAQAAPGPNVLLVSLVGWRLAGMTGLFAATAAILGPACLLALAAGRFMRSERMRPVVRLLHAGLSPVGVGLLLASGVRLSQAVAHDWITVLLCAGGAAFILFTKRNPFWVILGGATVGLVQAYA